MKKCNTELMKELKEVQALIDFAETRENRTATVTYSDADKSEIESEYDYETTRSNIAKLQQEERKIKSLLAVSNATTIVEGFAMTIAEALVYLAQLSSNKSRLTRLASRETVSREGANYRGFAEYTKARYDIKKAQADLAALNKEIARLQMAIDRTNLTNMVEC